LKMKASILTIVLAVFLILSFPADSSAMGNRENRNAYKIELQTLFDESIDGIFMNKTDAPAVKNKIEALRNVYDISYTDEAGILDAIIDRTAEKTFTKDESHFYFGLLNDGKLMEYRKENARKQSEQHQIEVLSLLLQNMKPETPNDPYAEELLDILNNYYDFLGLEYDEGYLKLSDLIYSLKEQSMDADEITAALESTNKKLVRQITEQQTQKVNRISTQDQSSSQSSLQNSDAPEAGGNTPNSPSSPGDSGTAAQKPSGSSSGPRN